MAIKAVCFVSNIIAAVTKELSKFFVYDKAECGMLGDYNSNAVYEMLILINKINSSSEMKSSYYQIYIILSPMKWILS